MSWTRTHEWWQALREVVAEIERRQDATLPWQPRYAEIFGDRAGLRRALGYRLALMEQAQVEEPYELGGRRSSQWLAFTARHRALRLVLDAPAADVADEREYALV